MQIKNHHRIAHGPAVDASANDAGAHVPEASESGYFDLDRLLALFADAKPHAATLRLYLVIRSMCRGTGEANYPGTGALARSLGYSRTTAHHAEQWLRSSRLIQLEGLSRQRRVRITPLS